MEMRNLPSAGRARRARPLVLIVDDDAHDRQIYSDILYYNGYDVALASDAYVALRHLANCLPDIMVLDLAMPGMGGLELCQEMKRRHPGHRTQVVALSGFSRGDMAARAHAAGCGHYLEKPASPVGLLHLVEELVGRPPLPGEGTPPQRTDAPCPVERPLDSAG
jgi:CheY-like chemotaxis protein